MIIKIDKLWSMRNVSLFFLPSFVTMHICDNDGGGGGCDHM